MTAVLLGFSIGSVGIGGFRTRFEKATEVRPTRFTIVVAEHESTGRVYMLTLAERGFDAARRRVAGLTGGWGRVESFLHGGRLVYLEGRA